MWAYGMNNAQEFLGAVLPQDGIYCVAGITEPDPDTGKKTIDQRFVGGVDEIIKNSQELVENEINAYVALATFKQSVRNQPSVQWVKSFWLDLDCGETKPYATQEDGLDALDEFLDQANLPAPMLINSGNGIHVYWTLAESITKDEWHPVASMLHNACGHYGLDVDTQITCDSARILRIPDTTNFKDPDNPKAVTVYQWTTPVAFSEFKSRLDALDLPAPKPKARSRVDLNGLSETARALLNSRTANFAKIVRRSLNGTGCAAIAHIVTNQNDVDEPLWRAGLSIAWTCEDREKAIHKMSSKHSAYNPEETLEKASLTKGPYTCDTFRRLDKALCTGCKHKITSPIQLGTMVIRAEEPEEVEEAEEVEDDGEVKIKDEGLPYNPPKPYFRAKDGGVYRIDGTGDDAEEIKVYEYDLYPFKRIHDPNDGESIVFKLIRPQDGTCEFTVPLKKLMSLDSFREAFGSQGVAATQYQLKEIMNYTIRYTKELQKLEKAHKARLQFGWTDDKKAFIVGNRAYTTRGIDHNPASSSTADYIRHMEPRGELSEWRLAFNVIAREGMEPLQFVALAGFAAPLMEFTGHAGATINLISNESGTGKSTAGYLALSVFGDPKQTSLVESDTPMAKLHHIGVFNNLCVMADEMTNMHPDVASNLIYAISQGRARHRMERDANRLRSNLSSWRTMLLTNSNASISAKLAKVKARPDGELMRLLEIHVDRLYVPDADELFDKMFKNYGVAGEKYAAWLVKNKDHLMALYDKQKKAIYDKIGKAMQERYWVAVAATILASGKVAQRLGLHDIDMVNLENWVIEYLTGQRESVQDDVVMANNLIGEFLMDNTNAILVVGERINPITGKNAIMPRSAKLVARFELKNRLMFIAKKSFREYCVDRQFTEKEALYDSQHPDSTLRYTRTIKKRMFTGTEILAPGVDAHVFQCAPEEAQALFEAIEQQCVDAG